MGRKLRTLPITCALFRAGKLTWSSVRLLSRVADRDDETLLCHASLDASVSDVERLCTEFRWNRESPLTDDENGSGEGLNVENARSLQPLAARSLTWRTLSNSITGITLSLPPELAEAFLNSVALTLPYSWPRTACRMPAGKWRRPTVIM